MASTAPNAGAASASGAPPDAGTAPKEGRRERKKRETRTRISDIATGLFLARGFDAVTIAEIAEAADVSVNTVYNYFPAKEDLFFDREDNKIGVQELLAIALLLATFPDKIEGKAMFAWCDNFGVVGAIKNGGSRTVDVNAVIGRLWLHMARLDAPVVFYYVHTKSNVADGATRNDCSFAEKFGAVWREPTFPDYVHEIWNAEEPERALRSLASDPRFTVPAPSEI